MMSACVFRSLTWAVQDASCCDVWSENSTLKSWWVWTSIHSSCLCTSLLSTPWLQTFWTQDKCLCLWSSCKVAPGHSTIHLLLLQLYERSSLISRLPLLFILWFAFSIIHRSGIILNTNWRAKNGGGPGNEAQRDQNWTVREHGNEAQVASGFFSLVNLFCFLLFPDNLQQGQ